MVESTTFRSQTKDVGFPEIEAVGAGGAGGAEDVVVGTRAVNLLGEHLYFEVLSVSDMFLSSTLRLLVF